MAWVLVRQGITYVMDGAAYTATIPTSKTKDGDLVIKLPSGLNIVLNDDAPVPAKRSSTKEQAIALVTDFCKIAEAFSPDAYEDPLSEDGLPITAGYGSTINRDGKPFRLGDRITGNEAEWLVRRDVTSFYEALTDTPYWNEMTAGQQAALTSLAYNKGTGNQDSLNACLKNKHWNDLGQILQKYDNKDQLGLSRRRYAEWLLWRGENAEAAYSKAWNMVSVEQINRAVLG